MCTDMVTSPSSGAMVLSTMFSPQQRPLSDNLAAATSPAISPALPHCWSGLGFQLFIYI